MQKYAQKRAKKNKSWKNIYTEAKSHKQKSAFRNPTFADKKLPFVFCGELSVEGQLPLKSTDTRALGVMTLIAKSKKTQ